MKTKDRGVKWCNTTFYPGNKTERAAEYEEALRRLGGEEITLFTPWGPRYDWESRGTSIKEDDRELDTLRFLAALLRQWQENMPDKNFRWMFLGADLYGTRINGLPAEVVNDYFKSLAERLRRLLPMAEFHLWSQFDDEAEAHRRQVRAKFDELIRPNTLQRAIATAQAMGKGDSAEESARKYLVERLAEAILVEEAIKPIKVSCAPRHKDDGVDGKMPRLYFLPPDLRAPWLGR